MATRQTRPRPEPPEEVAFPVTPMLDMAFQLLAFFVLTFQVPSREARLDLYLPAGPVALPGQGKPATGPAASRAESDLETSLVVRAEAGPGGALKSLRLGEAPLPDPEALGDSLRRYADLLEGRPLRVVLVADDALRYEVAADLVGTCSTAGAEAIHLADPASDGEGTSGP